MGTEEVTGLITGESIFLRDYVGKSFTPGRTDGQTGQERQHPLLKACVPETNSQKPEH